MAVWRLHDSIAVDIGDGILPADDFARLTHTEQILREAQETHERLVAEAELQASQIREAAQTEADQMLDQAQRQLDSAYQAGLDRGMQEAAARWASQALEIAANHKRVLERQSERLSQLVSAAVTRLVDEEDRSSLFRRSLRTISKLVKDVPLLTMYVHEAEREQAERAVASVLPQMSQGLSIEIIASNAVPTGTCRFESDEGVVDASLDTQITALRQAVHRAALDMLREENDATNALPADGP